MNSVDVMIYGSAKAVSGELVESGSYYEILSELGGFDADASRTARYPRQPPPYKAYSYPLERLSFAAYGHFGNAQSRLVDGKGGVFSSDRVDDEVIDIAVAAVKRNWSFVRRSSRWSF